MPAFSEIVSAARNLPEAMWTRQWDTPVLLVHSQALDSTSHTSLTRYGSVFETEQSVVGFVGQDEAHAFLVQKRDRNAPFPDRIFVGRARTNDVVINARGISKLHCYFRFFNGQWLVADAGSKNGTFLSGEPLVSRQELPLRETAEVCIGPLRTMFVSSKALASILRKFM